MILFGTGPIIIFIILLTMDNKEKKLIKKASKHFVPLKEETDNAMLKILGNNFYLSKYN